MILITGEPATSGWPSATSFSTSNPGSASAGPTTGASFWLNVLTELQPRGARRAIECCDGLAGLGEAICTTWPDAVVQTCVLHPCA